MRGHIRKRGKGSWTCVVDLGRDGVTGKRRQVWRSVEGSKRDAERVLAQLVHQRDLGFDQPPGRVTVGEYLAKWLEDYARVGVAETTYVPYEVCVRRHLARALGSLPLTKLRPQHIQAYYSRALREGRADGRGGLSPSTVLYHHRVLHEALEHAVRWQLLAGNPADSVEPPRVGRPQTRALDQGEVHRLLDVAQETPFGALVHLAVLTGLRKGELLGLRWRDIDTDRSSLYVRQTVQRVGRFGL